MTIEEFRLINLVILICLGVCGLGLCFWASYQEYKQKKQIIANIRSRKRTVRLEE